jgi:sec-independent protein translocase protein TatB
MFDIGWGKIVIIAVIALIVIGPKELPAVLRTVGQWMGKIRRMAAEFQGQFQEAMREAEMADLKKHVDTISEATRDIGSFDPLATARKDIESAFEDKPAATGSDMLATPASGEPANAAATHEVAAHEPAAPPVEPPLPIEPQLPFPEPAAPVASKDVAGTVEHAPATPAGDAGGRPA